MNNMFNKYTTLVENGTFNTVSETQKKLVALQAKIKKQEQFLKDRNLSLSKKLLGRLKNKLGKEDKRTPLV